MDASEELIPFDFKWSIPMFLLSGIGFMACRLFWRFLESNHVTYITDGCRGIRVEGKRRPVIVAEIVNYILTCETYTNLFIKFFISNIFTLAVIAALLIWYLDVLDYFNNPFNIEDAYTWVNMESLDRKDQIYKVFPRTLAFELQNIGSSGSIEKRFVFCVSTINRSLEHMYIIAVLLLPTLLILQLINFILILLAIFFFKRTSTIESKNMANFSMSQRLRLLLVSKNVDLIMWNEIMEKINDSTVPVRKTQSNLNFLKKHSFELSEDLLNIAEDKKDD